MIVARRAQRLRSRTGPGYFGAREAAIKVTMTAGEMCERVTMSVACLWPPYLRGQVSCWVTAVTPSLGPFGSIMSPD